jgi:hypothetical protein
MGARGTGHWVLGHSLRTVGGRDSFTARLSVVGQFERSSIGPRVIPTRFPQGAEKPVRKERHDPGPSVDSPCQTPSSLWIPRGKPVERWGMTSLVLSVSCRTGVDQRAWYEAGWYLRRGGQHG